MTDKEVINGCPNININKSSKEMIEDYIRNIAQQEIIKDKIEQLEFKMQFDKMQDKIKSKIWSKLNNG